MKNLIIVLVDAFRPDHLSIFGYSKQTDKNLKALVKDSILFKNHFSTSNSTSPSLASILTGRYPNNHGVLHQLPYNEEDEFVNFEKAQSEFWLPDFLKSNGYETIGVDWLGMYFQRGFDYYGEISSNKTPKNPEAPFTSTEEMTDLAIHRIKNSKKPFFLFMHLWDTHFPFPNVNYKGEGSKKDIKDMLMSIKDEKERAYMLKRIKNKNLFTIQQMIEKYDLAIKKIDLNIKRLQDFLIKENLWENTILLFLGDHATSLGEHGIFFSHSGLYDVSLKVPFIMRIPRVGHKNVEQFTQHVDIVPTILDYLGLDSKLKFDGVSMRSIFENNSFIRNEMFFFDGLCKNIRAVRLRNKKLIFAKDNLCHLCKGTHHSEFEEYDLDKDPNEIKNIYKKDSDLKESMFKIMNKEE